MVYVSGRINILESLCDVTYPYSILSLEEHRIKFQSQINVIFSGIKAGISDNSNEIPTLSCYSQLYKSTFITMNIHPTFEDVLNYIYPSMNYVSDRIAPIINNNEKEYYIGYILYSTSLGNINYISLKVLFCCSL